MRSLRPVIASILLCLLSSGAFGADRGPECAAWPGEVEPLPSVESRSPALARWAELREAELARLARSLEAAAPVDAYRLWHHALCLDPGSDAARAGLVRTQPIAVRRVALSSASGSDERSEGPGQGSEDRSETSAPGSHEGSEVPAGTADRPTLDPTDIDLELDEIDRMVAEARFLSALSVARSTRSALDERPSSEALRARRVRLEVLSATAEVALGRQADARASLLRALRAEPALRLDPATTSPKVLESLEAARAERQGR
jgi:hypothetical protein